MTTPGPIVKINGLTTRYYKNKPVKMLNGDYYISGKYTGPIATGNSEYYDDPYAIEDYENKNKKGVVIEKVEKGVKGKMEYENGDVYVGYFRRHPDGKGTMTYSNGDVYDGEWHEGTRRGKGKMTTANGNVYDGEWRSDPSKMNGVIFRGKTKDGVSVFLSSKEISYTFPDDTTFNKKPGAKTGVLTLQNKKKLKIPGLLLDPNSPDTNTNNNEGVVSLQAMARHVLKTNPGVLHETLENIGEKEKENVVKLLGYIQEEEGLLKKKSKEELKKKEEQKTKGEQTGSGKRKTNKKRTKRRSTHRKRK